MENSKQANSNKNSQISQEISDIVFIPKRKNRIFITFFFGFLLLIFILSLAIIRLSNNQSLSNKSPNSIEIISQDRTFKFQGYNQNSKQQGVITFKINNVEKTDNVLVNSQEFHAKNKKLFLIVNLELQNETSYSLSIIPSDFIKLLYDNQQFNPDLHNNLLSVEATSTKKDRIGFVIPEDNRKYILAVGQTGSDKSEIDINFTK